ASGIASHAEGNATEAIGQFSHAEGFFTTASGLDSHAEGFITTASGDFSHAEGLFAGAIGEQSHAEGNSTTASGIASHGEGNVTQAIGDQSHAEGNATQAIGADSHAEGSSTKAGGIASHAEGNATEASGLDSHAEGSGTIASGAASHAEGAGTIASGDNSHAAGNFTVADATNSFAGGLNTNTGGLTGAYIMGENGTARFPNSFHVANGLEIGPTLNSVILDGPDGNIFLDGAVFSPAAADYAEMFETIDGQPIEPGFFVTLEGKKIRLATDADAYVLGVTSATPAIVADSSDLHWHGLFAKDSFGRLLKDENGERILSVDYNPNLTYVPRRERPEWVAVGMLGKLIVWDDGSCVEDGYCRPNAQGKATAANEGYRVMERINESLIRIMFR
ncbi:exosporium leader peptide, partial [Paenibacillus larvae]|uniref:peptidase G2 autoproteolytic cleavage domain-containing protein n=1 Tax=Paenibacillus larvae TaxID=1464 RepID=UPI002DDD0BC6